MSLNLYSEFSFVALASSLKSYNQGAQATFRGVLAIKESTILQCAGIGTFILTVR